MFNYFGRWICIIFLTAVSAQAASGTSKPAVEARIDMEARSAQIYSEAMIAANQASHYAYDQVAKGRKEYADAARTLSDTADIAGLTAKLTSQMSPLANQLREVLAKACEAAMRECEKLNDPAFAMCMEACKKAAQDCRDMMKTQ